MEGWQGNPAKRSVCQEVKIKGICGGEFVVKGESYEFAKGVLLRGGSLRGCKMNGYAKGNSLRVGSRCRNSRFPDENTRTILRQY